MIGSSMIAKEYRTVPVIASNREGGEVVNHLGPNPYPVSKPTSFLRLAARMLVESLIGQHPLLRLLKTKSYSALT